MRGRLNKIKIILCVLVFSTSLFTPAGTSLSENKTPWQKEDAMKRMLIEQKRLEKERERAKKKAFEKWKEEKRAGERAKKKAFEKWKEEKRAREREKNTNRKKWEKQRKDEARRKAEDLAQLETRKLEVRRRRLELEDEKIRLEQEKIREKEEKRRIEEKKLSLAEQELEAKELAAERELARLKREKVREKIGEQEIERRRLALAEKEEESRARAGQMELARLEAEKRELEEKQLELENEKLLLEKRKLEEEEEKRQIEEKRIAMAEKEMEAEKLAAKRQLAHLEKEKLMEKREAREAEERRLALEEKRKEEAARAEAKEYAEFEKERRKKQIRRRKSVGNIAANLLGKDTLTLDECITVAMETNIPLKVAEKQLKLARFRLLEAKRNLGPSVAVKWEESEGRVSERLYTGQKIMVEGKQPVFYGGELVFSVKQAGINLEIVETDYDRVKNELILQVKKAYYTLDKAKKALAIQEGLRDRTKVLFDMVKAGYEAGVIPQVEFLKISSQHNQANFQAISAIEDISVARLLLGQAMGVEDEIEIAAVGEPEIIEVDMEDCFSMASYNRPEIKINQLSLEYFRYEKKIKEARANWPRVDFLGAYGNTKEDYVKEDIDSGADPRNLGPEFYFGTKVSLPLWGSTFSYSYTEEEWTPVVQTTKGTESRTHSASFSLFDKLEDISGVKEAGVEYMRAIDEMNKKKQEITLEVRETFFKYKKAILLMEVAESKVEFQRKQVEILEIRRELGEAQYSDVVEEMIKLAEEEFSRTQAVSDYYISIASLNKAIGIEDYFEA